MPIMPDDYKPEPRATDSLMVGVFLGAIIFVAMLIINHEGIHYSRLFGHFNPIIWFFSLFLFWFWYIAIVAVVSGIYRVIIAIWDFLPFRIMLINKMRDRKAKSLGDSLQCDPNTKIALLLRPFEFVSTLSLLPSLIKETDFTPSDIPVGDTVTSWNELFSNTDRPVELFDAITTSIKDGTRVIAVGERIKGQKGGAGLYVIDDKNKSLGTEHWKPKVADLIEQSEVIFILPWNSKGTMWELDYIFRKKILHKTIFIIPPIYKLSGAKNSDNEKCFLKIVGNRQTRDERLYTLPKLAKALFKFKQFGLNVPKLSLEGFLFFYIDKQRYQFPITYNEYQMNIFLDWRAQLMRGKFE